MAEQIDLDEFMQRFSEVVDYAYRRLIHSRPDQQRFQSTNTASETFAAPPAEELADGETPGDVVVPPDLFEAFANEEHQRLEVDAAAASRDGLDLEVAKATLDMQQDYVASTRRINESIMRFMQQAAEDNHRDSQHMERTVNSFLESRDSITD